MDAEALLLSLRRKEGNWVAWGQACQDLQKGGHSPQAIFEATGFEPIHQNQIIVAVQVYQAITDPAVQTYFSERGSDSLYALRILPNRDREAVASLLMTMQLDSEAAHDVAKAVKDYSFLKTKPYTEHPGDAVAYQAWRLAKQQADLQVRSRLIAKGLKFAHSEAARQDLEALLTDFSVAKEAAAPFLPTYRLESEDELPCLIPVVGKLPLTVADWQATPVLAPLEPFGIVPYNGMGAFLAIPGWKAVLAAKDPVAFGALGETLPGELTGEVLVVADREISHWDGEGYSVVVRAEQLSVVWSPETTDRVVGRVILVLRPPRIFDSNATKDPWQMDE